MASISFKHVYKTFEDGVTVVPDLNLEIADKEFVILVGPSGCGKSTTLRMIAGLEDVSSGELRIGERVVNDVAPKDRDIAMVFQNYALYPHMTVYKNIAFGLMQKKGPQKLPKAEIDRRVREAAKALDLEHLLNRRPKELSGGQRQRVSLGRAMVRDPAVFLLDEPLSNLDAKLRTGMRTEITRLHKRLQTTFVYVTHDQTEAMTMGDRIVVMKDGVIQQNDAPQVLYDSPCNRFVAGFIGSPQMNFLDARVGGTAAAPFLETCGGTIPLPPRMGDAVAPYKGRDVVLGIRPEDIRAVGSGEGGPGRLFATVEIAERLGPETSLHVECQGHRLVVKAPAAFAGQEGDVAVLALDPEKIHLFDKETEEAIAH